MICIYPECQNPTKSKGYCNTHYSHYYKVKKEMNSEPSLDDVIAWNKDKQDRKAEANAAKRLRRAEISAMRANRGPDDLDPATRRKKPSDLVWACAGCGSFTMESLYRLFFDPDNVATATRRPKDRDTPINSGFADPAPLAKTHTNYYCADCFAQNFSDDWLTQEDAEEEKPPKGIKLDPIISYYSELEKEGKGFTGANVPIMRQTSPFDMVHGIRMPEYEGK